MPKTRCGEVLPSGGTADTLLYVSHRRDTRTIALVPILLVAVTRVNGAEVAGSSQPTLAFYVVSEKTVEGGRFIDTKEFPKLGFIRQTPDLVLTQLEAVARARSGTIIMDKGKPVGLSETREDALEITLGPEDVRKFGDLTKKNIGNRILLLLGETPLIAPVVMGPISSPTIQITALKEKDLNKVEEGLRKLVKKP